MRFAKPLSTACAIGWHSLPVCALWVVVALSPSGCGPKYVAAPESPMLILDAKGTVKVAMMDGDEMVEVGWIDAADLEGQTVVHYDWTAP